MKTSTLIKLFSLALVPMLLISCGEDEPEPEDLIPNLSGLYVFGSNTVASTSVEPAAKMPLAKMNPSKTDGNETVDGIYGKLMYIGANSTIQFTEVVDSAGINYGTESGGFIEAGAELAYTDVDADIIHDTLIVDGLPVEIAEEGLYYVYLDMNTLEIRIMKVDAQMIGDATEAQWSAGTPLPQVHASVDSAVFQATELPLVGASGYKYRFSNGWELYNDDSKATFTHLGVESYGDAWASGINDVGYFEENIPNKDDGIFTVRLKFDAATGEWDETKIKTSSILIDYSANQIGLFGNAYLLAPGDTANWASGEDGYGIHAPEVSGHVYTWSWDAVDLLQDREFIFLENGAWGGIQLDYSNFSSVEGPAVDNGDIVDATTLGGEYHNFYVVTGEAYNISLVIDAEADTKTVSFSSAK
ncbi:MAG: hypothetical protein K9J30_11370 [Bacteroidales bacterium]|nr:hypothetical protein [Bacteroidales bacterium]